MYPNDIVRVSVGVSGEEIFNLSSSTSVSPDGRYIAFDTIVNNGHVTSIKDMQTGSIIIIDGQIFEHGFSADGNYVVYDDNGTPDNIFIMNLNTKDIRQVTNNVQGGGGYNYSSTISADGRYIAFVSTYSNLVAGDTNSADDIFVKDTLTGSLSRVSIDAFGNQGNNSSFGCSISSDGRYVSFMSTASNLVAGDTNGSTDVFIRDLQNNTIKRVSESASGQSGGGCISFDMSADGRYIVFESIANNFVSGDINGREDIFIKDTLDGSIRNITQGMNGASWYPAISGDGRFVVFQSVADNIVPGDNRINTWDIYIKDLQTGEIKIVTTSATGAQGNGWSMAAEISYDGKYIVFQSKASNLVAGDTNNEQDVFRVANPFIDTTSPKVVSFSPAGGLISVSVDTNLVIKFSESIVSGTGNFVIFNSNGTVAKTIAVNDTSQVSISGNTVTLNPSTDLVTGSSYYVNMSPGVIKDLAGNNFAGITDATTDNFTTANAVNDTIAPTVLTYIPADEASGVAVSSNIVLTFSEAIQRGTGNILLKTSTGTTVATYDAATSSNLSISGSTLTINPTADLTTGTSYKVEFAAGTLKDLSGNAYAGTTSYNFTTASSTNPTPTLSKDAQYLVLQPSSPAMIGAGAGDDTYLISGSMIPAGKNLTITDTSGTNSIQLAPGLAITSSQVTSSALKLTLNNGSTVTILGANNFTYDVGGNSTTGNDQSDVSFNTFVTGTLGTTIPTSGISTGSSQVIGAANAATALASTSSGDDYVIPQYASPAMIGAGAGNDTYLITNTLLPAGTNLTITDTSGSNSIQLAAGLSIASSQVTSTALKLTLASGATLTILGANNFTYDIGGNTTAGIDQTDVSYSTFVTGTLGTTIPSSGIATGGAVVIGGGSTTGTPVQGNATVTATAANDLFTFDAVVALQDTAGTNTQATISGFSTSADKLQINLPTANASITNLGQLHGQQGVSVQSDPFTGSTLMSFGNDANGGQIVSLTLTGISDASLVSVQVI